MSTKEMADLAEASQKNAHTPGPWYVEEGTTVVWSKNAYDAGTNNVGCIVARAAQPSSWRGSRPTADEQDANASLIAAAPDLLAALAALVRQHDACCLPDDEQITAARAALTRATGAS